MKLIEMLKRRHVRLEHDLAAEQARKLPDPVRMARMKKLKLALKDRLNLLAQKQRQKNLPVSA